MLLVLSRMQGFGLPQSGDHCFQRRPVGACLLDAALVQSRQVVHHLSEAGHEASYDNVGAGAAAKNPLESGHQVGLAPRMEDGLLALLKLRRSALISSLAGRLLDEPQQVKATHGDVHAVARSADLGQDGAQALGKTVRRYERRGWPLRSSTSLFNCPRDFLF